ncbi:carbohydrate ABC transporter permease [Streptomyces sp. NBC_00448]|uniref:carbohydrate ABC transporter permease n=1 Tax=Streptomyces sp. NBC_00448 TaxID=2903652 RepID=UPI002E1C4792
MSTLSSSPAERKGVRTALGSFGRNALLSMTVLFFGAPIVWLLLAPTKTRDQLTGDQPLSFGSLSHVGSAWSHVFGYDHGIFGTWLGNSALISVAAVALALVTCVPAGYGLAKFAFVGRTTMLFLTLVTMIVPQAALILPLYLEMSAVNLTNSLWAVILPLSFYPFGVYIVYLHAMASVPNSLIEAGRLDGASEWRIFFRIYAPIARPAIAMVSFFSFVTAWNTFFLPYIMNTDPQLANVQTGLQLLVRNTNALGGANFTGIPVREPEVALAALISISPILLIFVFAQRFLVAGQKAGAEKE